MFITENEPGEVTADEPGELYPDGLIGQRSYRCVICGLCFREKDIMFYQQKPYGKPCGCYKDIRSIILDKRRDRDGSNKG